MSIEFNKYFGEEQFKNFVLECIKEKNRIYNTPIILLPREEKKDYFDFENLFDAKIQVDFLFNTYGETYLKIFYSSNENKIKEFIKEIQLKYYYQIHASIVIISLCEGKIESPGFIVLGINYVKELTKEYPFNYWNYIIQVDSNATLTEVQGKIQIEGNYIANDLKTRDKAILNDETSEDTNKKHQQEFKKEIIKKRPAIILGNGVSISYSGCTSWEGIISRLLDELIPTWFKKEEQIEKIIGKSDYYKTSLVKNEIKDDEYYRIIHTCIYPKSSDDTNKTNLLETLCKIKHKDISIPILTYNYDCFFEEEYGKLFSTKIHTVYNKETNKKTRKKILHLHGFFDKKDIFPKVKDTFILADEDYYNAYSKKSGWVVQTQKNYLKNFTCIFVGSSMTDLYQLSLIKDINERNKNWFCYALIRLKDTIEEKGKLSILKYYKVRGIKIIFVNNHEDVPLKIWDLFS